MHPAIFCAGTRTFRFDSARFRIKFRSLGGGGGERQNVGVNDKIIHNWEGGESGAQALERIYEKVSRMRVSHSAYSSYIWEINLSEMAVHLEGGGCYICNEMLHGSVALLMKSRKFV